MTTHSNNGSKALVGKHTPGPWIATNARGSGFQTSFGIKHKSEFVDGGEHAEVNVLHTTREAYETAKANAALIAAAPELLEALKALVADPYQVPWKSNIDRAKEAISRAEGR